MNRSMMAASAAISPWGVYGTHGRYGTERGTYGGVTLPEVARIASRQFTVAPSLTLLGVVAGLIVADRADRLLKAQKTAPKARRASKLTNEQKAALAVGGALLVNLAHIGASLAAAYRD